MNLRATITKNYLQTALADISSVGRHWFSLSRPGASMLEALVAEQGHDVFLSELPPEWEHVLAIASESSDTLSRIAAERSEQRAKGVPENALPV